jgi:tRNA G37 N-methylase TrmD
MVLKAEPLAKALSAAKARLPAGAPMIGLAAQGAPFDQATASKARWPAGIRAGAAGTKESTSGFRTR